MRPYVQRCPCDNIATIGWAPVHAATGASVPGEGWGPRWACDDRGCRWLARRAAEARAETLKPSGDYEAREVKPPPAR